MAGEAYARARLCVKAGDKAGAYAEFRTAADLAPGWAEARMGFGFACLALGRVSEAADAFVKVCDADESAVEARTVAGVCMSSLGRAAGAVLFFREAAALEPGKASHWINLGDALVRAGRNAEAVEAYAEGVRLMPGHPGARLKLALAYEREGDYYNAYASLKAAVSMNRRCAHAYYILGRVASKLGHLGEARSAFEEALEISPAYVEARMSLCDVCEASGDVEAAERHRGLLSIISEFGLRPAAAGAA